MRLRLLDLFCGAGGAAVGYHRAGFDVVGVDIKPQPRYPFKFEQWDALGFLQTHALYNEMPWDAIHASPPCQHASDLRHFHKDKRYSNLIPETRELLLEIGLPYVIENVEGAEL